MKKSLFLPIITLILLLFSCFNNEGGRDIRLNVVHIYGEVYCGEKIKVEIGNKTFDYDFDSSRSSYFENCNGGLAYFQQKIEHHTLFPKSIKFQSTLNEKIILHEILFPKQDSTDFYIYIYISAPHVKSGVDTILAPRELMGPESSFRIISTESKNQLSRRN